MVLPSHPIPGQLVDVRQRRYVVTDVKASALGSGGLPQVGERRQHLVTLSSVEDDALGEEPLRVVWEVEPGARVHETVELPSPGAGFDDPARLDAFLDAVRWGAISSADTGALQSPFRSGIEIEAYQLDPVARAIGMPRVNLLIADDVGLGKTIEAGLVAHELLLRYRARTVLIVCPSSIQIQWREQMRDKFGLEFRIVDGELMRDLRRTRGLHVNPWRHFPRLITSIDYLKRERPMRLLREVLGTEVSYPRKIDLLIVDEAHNVAPSGKGKYATDSLRTQAIRTLAPHCEHRLFLSATPHNGYPESFQALLELLDDQRFTRGTAPDRAQLRAVMVRRLKSELPVDELTGAPAFPRRVVAPLAVPYTAEERQAHAWLQEYSRLRLEGAQGQGERFATEFTLKMLKKRLFSSPEAFAITLERHLTSLGSARRRGAGTSLPSVGLLRRQIEAGEEEYEDDARYDDTAHETLEAATLLFRPPSPAEQQLLDQLRRWAEGARRRPDSKAAVLIRWLRQTLRTPEGGWSGDRALIFTEYRDTQRWLLELLAADSTIQTSTGAPGSGQRGNTRAAASRATGASGAAGEGVLLTLFGGMDVDEREAIKAAFQAHPEQAAVRILLATDAASEGIDLQNHCSRLIHYEIPWNPNRMEQRNGRIDRHGQRASEVQIFHFVGAGYHAGAATFGGNAGSLEGDLEFLWRAAQKVEQIREDLGSVGPVLAAQVERAMLGHGAHLDTAPTEHTAAAQRQLLKVEHEIGRRIRELHQRLQQSREELHLTPEHVHEVVDVALALAGQPPLIPVRLVGRDRAGATTTIDAYRLPALGGSWARCGEGLAHPHTGAIRPIVFDHELAAGRDDVVLAHLNHPLVAMCLRLLRAEIWSPPGQGKLSRVTARLIPDGIYAEPVAVAHGRVVLLGGDNTRLHEQVIAAGGVLRGGRFARLNVGEIDAALAAGTTRAVPESVRRELADLWPAHGEALRAALETRVEDLIGGMRRLLRERKERELRDIAEVLGELQSTIEKELAKDGPVQLALFSRGEREQYERNREALVQRAARIPEEIEREQALIGRRYVDPKPRLFPVSVTYLVPESWSDAVR